MKKLAPIFKEYLKDIEGYESNKIENPSLTYEIYREYSNLNDKEKKIEKTLKKIKAEYNDEKIAENELYNEFLKRELRNYQEVVTSFLINDEFLTKKITVEDLKKISKKLLFEITEYPFNEKYTQAFKPIWNKKLQIYEQSNVIGEFRKTSLYKENIKYRPANKIEKDIDKILSDTYQVLENSKSSMEDKIKTLGLFHLNFEFIHPFAEGNGRTGRILLNILSLQFGFLPPAFGNEQYKLLKEKSLGLVSPERYREIMNSSLINKEKEANWTLINSLPQEFEQYYFYALFETFNWGENKKKTEKEEKLINIYYSNYSIEEELEFQKFYNFTLKKVQSIFSNILKNNNKE